MKKQKKTSVFIKWYKKPVLMTCGGGVHIYMVTRRNIYNYWVPSRYYDFGIYAQGMGIVMSKI